MGVFYQLTESRHSYTVLTFHFGSSYWITKCLENLNVHSDNRLREVVIVNQNRGAPPPELLMLPRVKSVLEFPVNESQVAALGHDHPSSIDRAIKELKFQTSHVIILDSDCFPISPDWLDLLPEVALAADPAKSGLTHPCFMVLPVSYLHHLSFSEGIGDLGMDTGRLVGLQMSKVGLAFSMLTATKGFSGVKGVFYNSDSVFHFGSGSFANSKDPRLLRQVSSHLNRFFTKKVERGVYRLTLFEKFLFSIALGLLRFAETLKA
jgi:hypothetical protein